MAEVLISKMYYKTFCNLYGSCFNSFFCVYKTISIIMFTSRVCLQLILQLSKLKVTSNNAKAICLLKSLLIRPTGICKRADQSLLVIRFIYTFLRAKYEGVRTKSEKMWQYERFHIISDFQNRMCAHLDIFAFPFILCRRTQNRKKGM